MTIRRQGIHGRRNEDFLKIYTYNVKSKWSVKNEDFL